MAGPIARLREANAAAVTAAAVAQHPSFFAAAAGATRPITAAAEKINLQKSAEKQTLGNKPFRQWQREAWEYYDAIGEVKYAFSMVAAVFSRLRINAGVILDPIEAPASAAAIRRARTNDSTANPLEGPVTTIEDLSPAITDDVLKLADDLVAKLANGNGGWPNMLRQFSLNVSVAGECYLINYKNKWSIRSTEEVTIRESDSRAILRTMRSSSQTAGKELPVRTFVGRIWRMHPRYSDEPDCSMLALREMCDELLTLQRMIRGAARSQMNAGMLFVPDGLTAAARTPGDEEDDSDPFESELMDAMITPVTDEASAASVVPMLVRGPMELGNGLKHIEFGRAADKSLVDRAQTTLDRILQGIDVPKDIVTGLAHVKYSNAVQIDENLYRTHIEPLALMFCDALTDIYLRPALKAMVPELTDTDLQKIVVWYDPTEVTAKPDPATAANEGHTRYTLSDAAWRRAHGFANSDAPDQEELARRYAIDKGVPPPDILSNLIKQALPAVFDSAREQNIKDLPVPFPDSARQLLGETAPDPTLTPAQQSLLNTPPPPPTGGEGTETAPAAPPPRQAVPA